MTAGEAQLRFAADFAVFLAAASGLALCAVRPPLLVAPGRARWSLAGGLAALLAASVATGAGVVDDRGAATLVATRAGGAALLAAALAGWRGGRAGGLALAAAVAALLGAEAAVVAGQPVAADAVRLLAACAVAAATVLAGRRPIPARFATSAAAALLLVVLAVAVTVSAVLAGSVEDEARRGLAARARTEGALVEDAGRLAEFNATLTAETFAANLGDVVQRLARSTSPDPTGDAGRLALALERFAGELLRDADPHLGPILVLADADLRRLAVATPPGTPPVDEAVLAGVQGSAVTLTAAEQDSPVQSVVVAGGSALAVAAAPVVVPDELGVRTAEAVLVATSRLDAGYLDGRLALGPDTEPGEGDGTALATRSGVLAAAGTLPDAASVTAVASDALDGGQSVTRLAGDRLVTAQPVRAGDGTPVVALIASTPTAALAETRADLFRLLFGVAVAGTVLALVLTAFVGERVGSGLRRLTAAAGEVRSGNLAVAARLRSEDELGVLSEAFDSMTGSLRQMTAELRQAAEDEVRLRTRLEAVVGGMGEALVAVDAGGTVTDWNAAAEALTGVPAAEAIGRPVGEVVRAVDDAGADLAVRVAAVAASAADPVGPPWEASGRVVQPAGDEVPVAVSASPLRDAAGEPAGAVVLLRDVRREREVERVKAELLANISHELRTPLSPIKGYSQILRDRELAPADVRRFAAEIERSAARLERVVVQLVNVAAISAGRWSVRTEPAEVRDLLERVAARWAARVDGGTSIDVRVDRSVPKAWLDREAVEQALEELVDNAVRYSPEGGGIHLVGEVGEHPRLGPVVRVSVSDEGVGIPPDRLEAVVQDFTQVDGSITRSFGGLGLGLSLVARIAHAHGGELELRSRPGAGTTATMVLPVGEEG